MKNNNKKFIKAPRYLFRKLNILDLVSTIEVKTFIDIGCGAGELACTLAEHGLIGKGLDYSKGAIAAANKIKLERDLNNSNINFELQNSSKSKKYKDKYDLVVCCEVLEHVEDDYSLLSNLVKLSNKYILLSVPAKQRLYDSSDKAVGHFRRYEKHELLKLLKSQKLEIVSLDNYGYPFTNWVRILRKLSFYIKNYKNSHDSMDTKSMDSGINPVKLPAFLNSLDTEKAIKPFYYISKLFNKTDLGEGYVVLCRLK